MTLGEKVVIMLAAKTDEERKVAMSAGGDSQMRESRKREILLPAKRM